jgi:hypothetical protein
MGTSLSKEQLADVTLIAGMNKDLPASFKTTISGQTYTLSQLVAQVQTRVTTRQAVANAKGALKEALAAYAAACTQTQVIVTGLKQVLVVMYSSSPSVLADMGLRVRKARATSTVADKAAAIAKNLATRALRHTMGLKQKAEIKAPDAPTVIPSALQAATTPTSPTAGSLTKV